MADGSHLGFIQKPVTFEPFDITKPNKVSRLSTNPEFSQILKFSVFLEIQDGRWQPSWLYSEACNFWTVWDNQAKSGIQTQYKPRIQPDFEIFSFQKSKMVDGSHLGFIQKSVTFEPFEITKPNLVSRLSTNPEFSQILKFSVFGKSKMADGSHIGFIQKPVTFELFEITTLVFQLFGLNTKSQNY